MKRRSKIKYTNEPIGKVRVILDFLPSPENLVMKENTESKNDTKPFESLRHTLSGNV
ncbi:MAG TPA: hypothetical protein VGV92_02905 [Gammaproteobacteria bacterium]|nr:hypothetical protein [Gammaproteobacteria bacterium]